MSSPTLKCFLIFIFCWISVKSETVPTVSEPKSSSTYTSNLNYPYRQYSGSQYANWQTPGSPKSDSYGEYDYTAASHGGVGTQPMMYNYGVYPTKTKKRDGYLLRQDNDGGLGGGLGGLGGGDGGGAIGLVGLIGLAGLLVFLLPLLAPILLPIALPIALPILPILLLPLLLPLLLLALFIPIPVVSIPGRRSMENFVDGARIMVESSLSEECAERITCEISRGARLYGFDPKWITNYVDKSSTKSKWMTRVSNGLKASDCQDKCDFVNSIKKLLKLN